MRQLGLGEGMDVTHDKVSIEVLYNDSVGPDFLCESAGESCKKCLSAAVCCQHWRGHETRKGAEIENQPTFPGLIHISAV